MTVHHVVVKVDRDHLARLAKYWPVTDEDAYTASVECSDPAACHGWIECDGDHDGYDVDDEDSPAFEQYDGFEIHGVWHDYNSYGWVVDYPGCPVAGNADLYVDGIPMDREGRYEVEDYWDDTDCYLILVKEI